jgi:hypothetical protein
MALPFCITTFNVCYPLKVVNHSQCSKMYGVHVESKRGQILL